jgi:NADH-quinone oxidoreductase subunit M
LPEAHVEAPTAGSIVLAGLLLKVGTFGMFRFMFPFLNNIHVDFRAATYTIALFSVYYASLVAIRQQDLKKIIAYSSVAHMGFVVAGLFSMTYFGLLGSLFTMISHGVVASALFYLVGVVYERYQTRNVLYYGGLVNFMPLYAFFFFCLCWVI